MEKKIEVEIDGKKYRIMPHLLEDAAMFGASTVKRVTKEPPKELLKATEAPVKKVLPPILKVDPLTDEEPKEAVKKTIRKKPVQKV